jgi:hypothetical protein
MQSALLLHLPSVDIPQKGVAGNGICGFCLKAKMRTSTIAITTKQIKPAIKILLFFICLFAFALLLLFGIFS